MAYVWQPTLPQVAVHIPWLTIDQSQPGTQAFLDTFTATTIPDSDAATEHIVQAANLIGTMIGTLVTALEPVAAGVTALWAAATLAAAYARDADDAARATALMVLARAALKNLVDAADNTGAAPLSALPVMYAPDPVPWGDLYL